MLSKKAVSQMFLNRGLFHKGTHNWHEKWVSGKDSCDEGVPEDTAVPPPSVPDACWSLGDKVTMIWK